jgi:hypothetical protein
MVAGREGDALRVRLLCTTDGTTLNWETSYLDKIDGIKMMKGILQYVQTHGTRTPDSELIVV